MPPRGIEIEGAKFADYRKEIGKSQEELAAALGVSVRTISRIETSGVISSEVFVAFQVLLTAHNITITIANLRDDSATSEPSPSSIGSEEPSFIKGLFNAGMSKSNPVSRWRSLFSRRNRD